MGGSVSPSAPEHIAGEGKRSRWDSARVSLVMPIGVIVAVAIACVVVAVLTSARRADDVSFNRDQQLIRVSIEDHGKRVLRQLDSVAGTPRAAETMRLDFQPDWVNRHVGEWLESYFGHDIVVVVDGSDRVKYSRFRNPADESSVDPHTDLAASLDLLRGRLDAMPGQALALIAGQNPRHPGRHTALMQRFRNRPAIVTAEAVGGAADLGSGNGGAPIVFSIKYIDSGMLRDIGSELQLSGLHEIAGAAKSRSDYTLALADASGRPIARFAWKPTLPGRQVVFRVAPFIAVALAGFALLVALVMRYMRRTAAAIAAGESQLRHLAMHDPVCGLPNRIYFGERLEAVIDGVRGGGPTAAIFYIDLDHFKERQQHARPPDRR